MAVVSISSLCLSCSFNLLFNWFCSTNAFVACCSCTNCFLRDSTSVALVVVVIVKSPTADVVVDGTDACLASAVWKKLYR